MLIYFKRWKILINIHYACLIQYWTRKFSLSHTISLDICDTINSCYALTITIVIWWQTPVFKYIQTSILHVIDLLLILFINTIYEKPEFTNTYIKYLWTNIFYVIWKIMKTIVSITSIKTVRIQLKYYLLFFTRNVISCIQIIRL